MKTYRISKQEYLHIGPEMRSALFVLSTTNRKEAIYVIGCCVGTHLNVLLGWKEYTCSFKTAEDFNENIAFQMEDAHDYS